MQKISKQKCSPLQVLWMRLVHGTYALVPSSYSKLIKHSSLYDIFIQHSLNAASTEFFQLQLFKYQGWPHGERWFIYHQTQFLVIILLGGRSYDEMFYYGTIKVLIGQKDKALVFIFSEPLVKLMLIRAVGDSSNQREFSNHL